MPLPDDIRCCSRCFHGPQRPCPDMVQCLTDVSASPVCHESEPCSQKRKTWLAGQLRTDSGRPTVFIGTGTCGLGAGAGKVLNRLKKYVSENQLDVEIVEVGCIGLCVEEPIVEIQMPGRTRAAFRKVGEDGVVPLFEFVSKHGLPKNQAVYQHRRAKAKPWAGVPFMDEHPFFKPQTRWVLANCGVINPTRIEEYMAGGGYRALAKALAGFTPGELCIEIEKSGLRGRGGGGFLTGLKWRLAHENQAPQKYLICNADEGDPGAFMDRALIEGDPHRLLEGMALAAYAIGADKAIVYLRAEYPHAVKRLRQAIAQAGASGLLGSNILDSGFDLDIGIKMGAGAFVCGEETALMHSIEGRRGMPRPRPPFPSESGLFGKPTVINNVETLANVPAIVSNGAAWFGSVGTEKSKGTKVFALSGKISRTGLVEVAMGKRLRDLVEDAGGGVPDGKKFKAVQIGGPSGGCIPLSHLDILIDYESLQSVGAMMGSGGLVVMDETTCMVDVAKFFMDFIQRESCGKCIPCREGTRRMLEILQRMTRGRHKESGVEALERFKGVMIMNRLAKTIQDTSLCGLGRSAPNPVLSTLRWFRDEYEAHVYERKCPAGACTELLTYAIDPSLCKGCTLCAKNCPSLAVMGNPKAPHYIIPGKCIACGACRDVCKFKAVLVN